MEGSTLDYDELLSAVDGLRNGPGTFTDQTDKVWKSVQVQQAHRNSRKNTDSTTWADPVSNNGHKHGAVLQYTEARPFQTPSIGVGAIFPQQVDTPFVGSMGQMPTGGADTQQPTAS
eukprot:2008678-Rhodomonas_salina.1